MRARNVALVLRWSWRDLRSRWLQVAAIALIIGLGSGTYSGLSSTTAWRRASYDASFRRLHMYDLRVTLATGNTVDERALLDTIRSIPHASSIATVDGRLLVSTQVDASTRSRTILVPGQLVGVDVRDGGPHVNRVGATGGRALRASDAGRDVALMDVHFARHYHLPVEGSVRTSGGHTVHYVGHGLSPEYFLIMGAQGNLLAEANYAVLFAPLTTVQGMTGKPGAVNDAVVELRRGADVAGVRHEIEQALATRLPGVGATVNTRSSDRAYALLYNDIKGDQRLYDIFALLILAGAAFAAFNLTGRIVEHQRREIGVGMALGETPARLAVRPVLVGVEIALLGVVLGVGVGLVLDRLMLSYLRDFFPMPVWRSSFQLATFGRGALLGLVIPVVACLYPVWRAVRVAPVDAIRTIPVGGRRGGLAPYLARIPLPGRSTAQIPFRNVVRAPRRAGMTMLGIAAAITVLIGVVGMVDSVFATIDRADAELLKSSPRRLTVDLDFFYPVTSPQVAGVVDDPTVGRAHPSFRVGATLVRGRERIDTLVSVVDFDSPIWRPTILHRAPVRGPGIVVSHKAARDLGVKPGDAVALRHPVRQGLSYRFVTSRVPVLGETPLPTRFVTFMSTADANALMGLDGLTNSITVEPAPGVSDGQVERALFGKPGVGSVQPIASFTDTIRTELQRTLGILSIVEGAILLLALLIAFNSASINTDERAREHATMLAFGLRLRTVLRMNVVESLLVGIAGTVVGLAAGWLLLSALNRTLLPATIPDIGLVTSVSTGTLVTAVVLGVVAVTVAPLFTARKLWRTDIPSTLRVME
ncbi:MAG TPA: FtsX-like permease family protein [Acidimicrobiia bacterium]|nr:FtsX-like permease family protein [Acidimicrobiia bacterium]